MKKVAALTALGLVLMAVPAQARTLEGTHFFRTKNHGECGAVVAPGNLAMYYCQDVAGSLSGGAVALYRFPKLTGRTDVTVVCDCDAGRGYIRAKWLPERGVLRVSERAGIGVVYSVSVTSGPPMSGPAA